MNLSAAASATALGTPAPGLVQVGELSARFKSDEPIYITDTRNLPGGSGHSSLDDAMRAASAISTAQGGTFALVPVAGVFQAHALVQPVWRRSLGREEVFGYEKVQLQPLGTGNDPKFGFVSYHTDRFGGREEKTRTGKVQLDATSGVAAVVGSGWALVNGRVTPVAPPIPSQPPVDPRPPVDPVQPPVDPRPPVDPTPPVKPRPPVTPSLALLEDVTEAARLASSAARIVGTIPAGGTAEATKDLRVRAFKTNMASQERIERQFDANNAPDVVSTLRAADASLEDANWQITQDPSPDGRFNGIDQPGALRDTLRAVELLDGLLAKLTQPAAAAAA